MRKLMAASLSAAFVLAGSLAAETMTGVISDAKCGAAHAEHANAACVKACVKSGKAPVLVSDGKVYQIDDASKEKVMDHLGQKVKVDGSVSGDTVTIESIQAAGD